MVLVLPEPGRADQNHCEHVYKFACSVAFRVKGDKEVVSRRSRSQNGKSGDLRLCRACR